MAIASRSCVATTAMRIAASLRELVHFVASFSSCSSCACFSSKLTELITTGLMETADRIAAGLDIDPRVSVERLEKQRAAKAAAERAKLLAS